jgi:hypothetical protein
MKNGLTRTVVVEDDRHSMVVTLQEEMTLPEIWYSILGFGYAPAKASWVDGVAHITFGQRKQGSGCAN